MKRERDHTAAEDIVHDVLVKAYARQETLRNPEKLRPWLYQVTRNAIIDYYRMQKSSEALPDDMTREEQGGAHAERELARCLIPLLEELPDDTFTLDAAGAKRREAGTRSSPNQWGMWNLTAVEFKKRELEPEQEIPTWKLRYFSPESSDW